MTTFTDVLHVCASGDIHAGHPSIDHDKMYNSFTELLYPAIMNSHIFLMTGDFVHMLMMLANNTKYIVQIMNDLVSIHNEYGTIIRFIRGTYSHDRNQLRILANIANSVRGPKVDFKLYEGIGVETISSFKHKTLGTFEHPISIGYIPDNLSFKHADAVANALKESMDLSGISKLNLIGCHGSFDFAYPMGTPLPPGVFTVDTFAHLLDGPILASHIHMPYSKQNVHYTSSYERFKHGEEAAKGFLTATYDLNEWTVRRIKNKSATKYKTITITSADSADAVAEFHKKVHRAFGDDLRGHVRVIFSDILIKHALQAACQDSYPELFFDSKKIKDAEREHLLTTSSDYYEDVAAMVVPTPETLPSLLTDFQQNLRLEKGAEHLAESDFAELLRTLDAR